jgi:hypothetical protein
MTDPVTPEPTPYASPEPTPYASYNQQPVSKTPVLSIISMITGIIGVVGFLIGWGILPAIAAVVLGHLGQRKEKQAKGFWLTGLITGYVGILLNIIVIVLAVLVLMAGFSAYELQTGQ